MVLFLFYFSLGWAKEYGLHFQSFPTKFTVWVVYWTHVAGSITMNVPIESLRTRGGRMEQILGKHIEVTPDVAGGKPRIAGHRVTVQNVVVWHERLGMSADEIATEYGVTLADIFSALAYYYDHRAEIEQSLKEDAEVVTTLRARTPSKLKEKLGV